MGAVARRISGGWILHVLSLSLLLSLDRIPIDLVRRHPSIAHAQRLTHTDAGIVVQHRLRVGIHRMGRRRTSLLLLLPPGGGRTRHKVLRLGVWLRLIPILSRRLRLLRW